MSRTPGKKVVSLQLPRRHPGKGAPSSSSYPQVYDKRRHRAEQIATTSYYAYGPNTRGAGDAQLDTGAKPAAAIIDSSTTGEN